MFWYWQPSNCQNNVNLKVYLKTMISSKIFPFLNNKIFLDTLFKGNVLAISNNAIPLGILSSFKFSLRINQRVNYSRNVRESQIPLDYFDDKNVLTLDWNNVSNDLLTQNPKFIKEVMIDNQILMFLKRKELWEGGFQFIKYLQTKEINTAAELAILNFYHCYNFKVKPLNSEEKAYVLKLCHSIMEKNKIFTNSICTSLIEGLSLTTEWERCFELLEEIKKIVSPSDYVYSLTISAAFTNMNRDLGWKYLNEMIKNEKIPYEKVYTDWMNYCVSKYTSKTEMLSAIEELFELCSENDFKFNEDTAKHIAHIFSNHLGWNANFVKIMKSGECTCCKNSLTKIQLTKEEHNVLKERLLEKAIIGKTIFAKSSPEEIRTFLDFINNEKPFDIVIDGLNIAFAKHATPDIRILLNVINALKTDYKRILVIGRNHMRKWPQINRVKSVAAEFYVDDLSYDDTFLLYACLYSPGCKFVSRDLMRGHKALFDDWNLRKLFKKWQLSSQYLLIYSDMKKRTVQFQTPAMSTPFIHKNKSWHIPYDYSEYNNRKEIFEFPTEWLCLSKPEK